MGTFRSSRDMSRSIRRQFFPFDTGLSALMLAVTFDGYHNARCAAIPLLTTP